MKGAPHYRGFRLALVGARLQGLEAAYLAREARYHVTIIDRDPGAPALPLAHQAHVFDVRKDPDRFHQLLLRVDAVLPATESKQTLDFLEEACRQAGRTILHDAAAYEISSSKVRSNAFFTRHDVPVPAKWPECHFPIIIKPSRSSGSHGVQVALDPDTLQAILPDVCRHHGEVVIEAYHKGPSLSLEVIARNGTGHGYLVTELEFDPGFDCKRVYAPSICANHMNQYLEEVSLRIARHLDLNGLMDVEVIVEASGGELAVLEIDARFPSQTPMAVFHATGINLLEEWVNVHVKGLTFCRVPEKHGCALLEHVAVSEGCLEFIGETHLLPWGDVNVWPNGRFFGATTALTDYFEGKDSFKGTLIFSAPDWFNVFENRQKCLDRMVSALELKNFYNSACPSLSIEKYE